MHDEAVANLGEDGTARPDGSGWGRDEVAGHGGGDGRDFGAQIGVTVAPPLGPR